MRYLAQTTEPLYATGYLLEHVANVVHRQSDQALQERLGIGWSQFKILMILQARPHVKQRDLAVCLGQTEASISRQVALMQDKGLLATRVDPAERRRHIAAPTPKGLKLTEAAREIVNNYRAPLLEQLNSKQREQFLEMLKILHAYTCAPGRPASCQQIANDNQN